MSIRFFVPKVRLQLKLGTIASYPQITAFLVRGRVYSIELEAKCDMNVPLLGAAVCSFFDAQLDIPGADALFDGDGFDVGNITVSVESDPVEAILN